MVRAVLAGATAGAAAVVAKRAADQEEAATKEAGLTENADQASSSETKSE
jgi:hypothetical protein